MKKVIIIGASGKVGKIITEKMSQSVDFKPTAVFRKEEQKEYFEELNVNYKIASIEVEVDTLAEVIKGADAVVFTAGSGGNTGYDKTLTVDLDGAVKVMEASLKAGVKRFVMVSALGADDRSGWEGAKIKPYYVAKHYADQVLKSIGLDYTIVRPGRLLDEPGSGKIDTLAPKEKRGIPREDVAQTVLEVLKNDNSIGKIIEFNEGETSIDEAVIQL
ncbi:SDR family oxidoreductase [Chondrinema litorale]|uniref:SDR family oxidoreductase n=1 Tax=Chondrinema litorale TaxID=2994555 RepID=UPI002542FE69|nr:SDR family oxidoreductase [Chondrinema litorale]UZR99533.1 SDR family oxidoreductase [Chondrinema litorale]